MATSGSFTSEFFTKEKRKEWSDKQRVTWTPERRAACSEWMKKRMTGSKMSKETRAKMSAAQTGRIFSEESKKKISASHIGITNPAYGRKIKKHLKETVGVCRCQYHRAGVGHPTKIEDILVRILLREFPKVIREKRFGYYRVDAYLPPPYHLAFEADGAHWHSGKEAEHRDRKRDKILKKEYSLPVIRLGEHELWAIWKISKTTEGQS